MRPRISIRASVRPSVGPSIRPCVRYACSQVTPIHLNSPTHHPRPFLDASSHLYKRVCPSVCPSVGPSVRPCVHSWEHFIVVACLRWSSRHPSHLHNSIFFMSNSLNKIAFESCISSLLLLNSISFLVLIKQKHVSTYHCCLKQNFLRTFSSLKESSFVT